MPILKNAVLRQMEVYAQANNVPIIKKDTAEKLAAVCAEFKPCDILEIGTAIGYSGSAMLLSSGENARLTTVDISVPAIDRAKKNFELLGLTKQVTIINQDCIEALTNLVQTNQKFDFVFLDGPKALYSDCFKLIKCLIKKGSVLFADNVDFAKNGREDIKQARMERVSQKIEEFKAAITMSPDLKTEFFDIGDGVSITVFT